MGMTQAGGAPWLMAAMLAAGAVAAPGLESQEVAPPGDSDETGERPFSVSAGARLEIFESRRPVRALGRPGLRNGCGFRWSFSPRWYAGTSSMTL